MTPTPYASYETAPKTAAHLRDWAEAELALAGVPSPGADAGALTACAYGWDVCEFAKHVRDVAPPGVFERLNVLARRRGDGEPLQLIIGTAPFVGLSLAVAPGVFIPRPETEGLALWAEESIADKDAPVVVDLCAGVGPLAVYLARRRPDARVVAVEVDEQAASLLRNNAVAHDVRVDVIVGDIRDGGVASRLPAADLAVANPPYVETAVIPTLPAEIRAWEPRTALDGGADGLALYPVLAALAARILKEGGVVAVEIGESCGDAVSGMFSTIGEVEIGRDLAGRDRYVRARKANGI
jgi:release factor glutamine methyltransferase